MFLSRLRLLLALLAPPLLLLLLALRPSPACAVPGTPHGAQTPLQQPAAAAATPAARNPPIAPSLFAALEELSRIVDIAYCVGSLNTGVSKPFQCLSFCDDFPTFSLEQTWNTGPTLSDSCGYIALSHPPAVPRIIVAFRGTYSLANALADLTLAQQEYVPYPSRRCDGCLVHAGFLQSWAHANATVSPVVARLRDAYPAYELTLVGHSLGGAVAALAALDYAARGWAPVVTTFGEPKVGNAALADHVDGVVGAGGALLRRVTHAGDPVPTVPWGAWGYRQHAGELFVERGPLPCGRCDVRVCVGQEDPGCVAGGSANAVQALWAHRDYFHRMGLCVPQDSVLRKIGVLDAGPEEVLGATEEEEGDECED